MCGSGRVYLQPSVQRPLDGDTLAGMDSAGGDGGDERVQFVLLLLQLLHQTLDGPLGEALVLGALPVAHEAVDDAQAGVGAAAGGRAEHRHVHLQGTEPLDHEVTDTEQSPGSDSHLQPINQFIN